MSTPAFVAVRVTYQDGVSTEFRFRPGENWSGFVNEQRLAGHPVEVRHFGRCEHCGGPLPCYCDMEGR